MTQYTIHPLMLHVTILGVVFIVEVVLIVNVIFIFEVIFIFKVVIIFEVVFIFVVIFIFALCAAELKSNVNITQFVFSHIQIFALL